MAGIGEFDHHQLAFDAVPHEDHPVVHTRHMVSAVGDWTYPDRADYLTGPRARSSLLRREASLFWSVMIHLFLAIASWRYRSITIRLDFNWYGTEVTMTPFIKCSRALITSAV